MNNKMKKILKNSISLNPSVFKCYKFNFDMRNQEKISPLFEEQCSTNEKKHYHLILHNDEVNTFDHVIDTLIEVCNHDVIQAEQCAHITHYKGKCDVKTGEFELLSFMKGKLASKGLSVTID